MLGEPDPVCVRFVDGEFLSSSSPESGSIFDVGSLTSEEIYLPRSRFRVGAGLGVSGGIS